VFRLCRVEPARRSQQRKKGALSPRLGDALHPVDVHPRRSGVRLADPSCAAPPGSPATVFGRSSRGDYCGSWAMRGIALGDVAACTPYPPTAVEKQTSREVRDVATTGLVGHYARAMRATPI